MSMYVPSYQKALGSTPAIHTYPIQVVFQIDQSPGQYIICLWILKVARLAYTNIQVKYCNHQSINRYYEMGPT